MERTSEEALRTLAYFYNEKIIYAHNTLYPFSKGEVEVKHIRSESVSSMLMEDGKPVRKIFSIGYVYKTATTYIVRVSYSFVECGIFQEVKWEGPLQEWYQACAEIIKEKSQEQIGLLNE